MISWGLVPGLRVALALSWGIIAAHQATSFSFWIVSFSVLLLLLWHLDAFAERSMLGVRLKGFSLYLFASFIGFGLATVDIQKSSNTEEYYAKDGFIFTLTKAPRLSEKWCQLEGQVSLLKSDSTHTAVDFKAKVLSPLVYATEDMIVGAKFLIKARLGPLRNIPNPHASSYADYLISQGIRHQAFVKEPKNLNQELDNIQLLEKGPKPGWIATARNWIAERVESHFPTASEAAVAKALLIGDKSTLDSKTRNDYASTGAIHVLAVSGLHTGIIASICFFLLGYFFKYRFAILKLLLFWLCLYTYVHLTGFAPSVQRSAVMFGILYTGKTFRKSNPAFNSLGISAIVLLSHDPGLLFDLGFQLSYSAVAGILAFYPTMNEWFRSGSSWLNSFNSLVVVSFAATLGTLPLTIYYFHQFPVYFLVSSVLVVPLISYSLPVLFGTLALDFCLMILGLDFQYLYQPAYYLIYSCNAVLAWVSALPQPLLLGLWPSLLTTILSLLAIALIGVSVLKRSNTVFWAGTICLVFWSFSVLWDTLYKYEQNELVAYYTKSGLVIDRIFKGARVTLKHGVNLGHRSIQNDRKLIVQHRSALNVSSADSIALVKLDSEYGHFYAIKEFKIAVIDSNSFPLVKDAPLVDYVFVRKADNIDPVLLQDAFPYAPIIVNQSIVPWKRDKWEDLSKPVFFQAIQGAFIESF